VNTVAPAAQGQGLAGLRTALLGALLVAACAGAAGAADGVAVGVSHDLSMDHPPGSDFMGVRLLGTLNLHAARLPGGHTLHSLSALGFDEDADLLYALSDRGVLFHIALEFEPPAGHLIQARVLRAYPLQDTRGAPLRGRMADAEGMVLRDARNGVAGDTQVLVSFERRARVMVFDPTGVAVGAVALPDALRDPQAYRGGNKSLEAVTLHPQLGVLVAPEQPLLGQPGNRVHIHAAAGQVSWDYPRPVDPNHALVALETLPDGRLLTLERAHGFLFVPFITVLRRLPRPPPGGGPLEDGEEIARFNTGNGFALDNFEGLTRHLGHRFLMVSDDNAKPFQASLLSYFEILDRGTVRPPDQRR
jgi:hypothetical protein